MGSPFAQLRSYQRNLRYQGYQAVPVEEFGGLNLIGDPGEIGWSGAIDLLNVEIEPGHVKSRWGTTRIGSATGNIIATWDQPYTHFITTDGTNMRAYTSACVLKDTYATTKAYTNAASLGTAAAGPYLYIAGDETAQIVRYDGTVFSAPAGMPNARFVATTADFRLAAAYTSTAQLSRVQFSDPGAPETWGASNFIDLHPNDGEYITGMVAWNNLLFVFKASKYYVFYGTSTDATGNPIFNYRTINTGIGVSSTQRPYVATPQGVFFTASDGVYLTTGGPPVLVSRALDPLIKPGLSNSFFLAGANPSFSPSGPWTFSAGELYGKVTLGGTSYTLLYNLSAQSWNLWQITGGSTLYPLSVAAAGLVYSDGSGHVCKLNPAATSDDGTAITSRYRSGFYQVPGRSRADGRQSIRQWRLRGSGTVTFGVAADDAVAIPTTGGGAQASVDLTAALPNYRTSQLGYGFSWQVSATAPWRLDSVQADVT